MGEGLTITLSMKYAKHAPNSYKVQLKYGRLRLEDLNNACDATRGSDPEKTMHPWPEMSTRDLLKCQNEMMSELTRRDPLK